MTITEATFARRGVCLTDDQILALPALTADALAQISEACSACWPKRRDVTLVRTNTQNLRLPFQPVETIHKVEALDGHGGQHSVSFCWDGLDIIYLGCLSRVGSYRVDATFGTDQLPDAVEQVAVAMISRALSAVTATGGTAGGSGGGGQVQSESIGSYSITYATQSTSSAESTTQPTIKLFASDLEALKRAGLAKRSAGTIQLL